MQSDYNQFLKRAWKWIECLSILLVGINHLWRNWVGNGGESTFWVWLALAVEIFSWYLKRKHWFLDIFDPSPTFQLVCLGCFTKFSDYHRHSEKIKRKCWAGLSITARQAVSDGNKSGGMIMIMVIRPNSTRRLFIGERRIFMVSLQIAEQIRLIQFLLQLVDIETMRSWEKTFQPSRTTENASLGGNCLW